MEKESPPPSAILEMEAAKGGRNLAYFEEMLNTSFLSTFEIAIWQGCYG